MSEQALDPTTPIPNRDPRCRCELEPDSAAGDDAVIMGFGDEGGAQGTIAMHLDCPYHGGIARDIRKAQMAGFSTAR